MKPGAMKANAVLFVLSLSFAVNIFGQDSEKPVKMKDLPEAVRKTVREQAKGAAIRGLAKEVENGKTFYEAELKVNGHNKDVLIDSTGAVVEVEEQVALSSLPAEVRDTIQKAAGKGKITSVESITKNDTVDAYEAHLTRSGKRVEIKVSPSGKLITTEGVQNEKGETKKSSKKPTKP